MFICKVLHSHYSRFEVRLFIIRQSMNFGFWKKNLVQIIADYVNFHMTYHTYIWNHAGWHRSVLNMIHFQLFAWFGQTLSVRKMGKNLNFSFCIPLDPKPIFKDQVGSGPWAHTKMSSAKLVEGKKSPEKLTFSK